MLEDGGASPEGDSNQLREYRAMHEEKFLSSWLREDVEGRKAEMERLSEEAKQEKNKCGKKRGGEGRGKGRDHKNEFDSRVQRIFRALQSHDWAGE